MSKDKKWIGAHVSIAGGLDMAPGRAREIGADAMALFTKNQRQWRVPALQEEEIAGFSEALNGAGMGAAQVLPHDSYLINLAQSDPAKRQKAVEAFVVELQRVKALGLDRLNFHPGSHVNRVDPARALELIAQGMTEAAGQVSDVRLVVETTAGQGTALGASFEEIAELLDLFGQPDRCGVCIDTCHIFAAGYGLSTPSAWEETMARFDEVIGFHRLYGVHLNDSLREQGSRVDRHAPLGQGQIGEDAFRRIMEDPRFNRIPLILETPDQDLWAEEIRCLRGYASG